MGKKEFFNTKITTKETCLKAFGFKTPVMTEDNLLKNQPFFL